MTGEWFATAIEYLGVFAFAVSGFRIAATKRYDIFGAAVVGFATAVGGGTLRDVLIDQPVFWMESPNYLVCTLASFVFYALFRNQVNKFGETIRLFDTLGLAMFNMMGIKAALGAGYGMLVAVIMGVVTGAAGGVFRDLLSQVPPLIFQKSEIYASACLLGGMTYAAGTALGLHDIGVQSAAILVVIVVRILSRARNITLPYAP
ncbi:MAG: trimeric intracellular cation channel family protein [Kiritimatiellia bacterium]